MNSESNNQIIFDQEQADQHRLEDMSPNTLRRQQSHAYRVHRQQANYLMTREMIELFLIIVFIGVICVIGSGKQDDKTSKITEGTGEDFDWIMRAAIQLITVAVGFIIVIAMTHGLSRRSDMYKLYMTFFFGFLLMNFMAIFVFLSVGLSLSYGSEFQRKMYLIDPKRNTTKTVFDDGTYIVENDKVIGRQSIDKAKLNEDVAKSTEMEPIPFYLTRIIFVIACIITLIFLLLVLLSMAGLLCILITERYAGRDDARIQIETAMRNGRIMNVMKSMPFSTFMLRQARDCPICLEVFTDEDEVVQLKCSRYHIFHYHCMESYMAAGDQTVEKLCPLCRRTVEIEETPNLNSPSLSPSLLECTKRWKNQQQGDRKQLIKSNGDVNNNNSCSESPY